MSGEKSESESYRVNVPAADVPAMEEAPDSGYALVKFTKDGDAYCLDLQSLKLPETQPEDEDAPEKDEDMPLETFARKVAKDEGMEITD